ncbi:hypothetical protein DL98DRAFT_592820 [Cadophora sp. DSE1049]|nr:hypothetical protein DL98DRAFT_592820 [Cadophora sp. DSE1049]
MCLFSISDIEAGNAPQDGTRSRRVKIAPNTQMQTGVNPGEIRPWNKYVPGYPRYSAFIASDEDKSTTIFRRFQRLSTRNLLYLESELSELEAIQDRLDAEAKRDDDLELSAQSWELLRLQADGGCDVPCNEDTKEGVEQSERNARLQQAARERLEVALRIRHVLTEYQTALKLENDILALKPPDRRPLKGVRRIFYTSHNTPGLKKNPRGRGKTQLSGSGAGMIAGKISAHLDPNNEQDLCVLAPDVQKDRLTRLFEGRMSYFFRARTDDGLSDFVSHSKVALAVTILSGLMATVFLIGAIVGLYWVEDPRTKLGILSGLTVAFAGTLALFTNARRQDVFAATAAYAAVLVVFISGNLTSGKSETGTQSVITVPAISTSVLSSVMTATSFSFITATSISSATATITLGSSSSTPTPSGDSSSGLSRPAIIAISVLVPLAVLSAVLGGYFAFRQYRKSVREAQIRALGRPAIAEGQWLGTEEVVVRRTTQPSELNSSSFAYREPTL